MTPVLICPHVGPFSPQEALRAYVEDLKVRMAAALPEDRETYQNVINRVEAWIDSGGSRGW